MILYSLSSLVICTVVSQVTLLPSYNGEATASSLCSLPIPILFQFNLIYLNFVDVITESWWLRDHSRWVFRKNSMEFSVGFGYLLILLYKWLCPYYYTITWLCHMIWLPSPPCYLYLHLIIRLDIRDQIFKCMGNSFLSGALITL